MRRNSHGSCWGELPCEFRLMRDGGLRKSATKPEPQNWGCQTFSPPLSEVQAPDRGARELEGLLEPVKLSELLEGQTQANWVEAKLLPKLRQVLFSLCHGSSAMRADHGIPLLPLSEPGKSSWLAHRGSRTGALAEPSRVIHPDAQLGATWWVDRWLLQLEPVVGQFDPLLAKGQDLETSPARKMFTFLDERWRWPSLGPGNLVLSKGVRFSKHHYDQDGRRESAGSSAPDPGSQDQGAAPGKLKLGKRRSQMPYKRLSGCGRGNTTPKKARRQGGRHDRCKPSLGSNPGLRAPSSPPPLKARALGLDGQRRWAPPKAQPISKSRWGAKTTSPFELYSVGRSGGWLDGGGKTRGWTNPALPLQRQLGGAGRDQSQRNSLPTREPDAQPLPNSFGSWVSCAGAPTRTDQGVVPHASRPAATRAFKFGTACPGWQTEKKRPRRSCF